MTQPTTHYLGYEIDLLNDIYLNGRKIFTNPWFARCASKQDAMRLIDSSLKMKAKQDKQAALKKLSTIISGECELENGTERREREEEMVNNYFESELLK